MKKVIVSLIVILTIGCSSNIELKSKKEFKNNSNRLNQVCKEVDSVYRQM